MTHRSFQFLYVILIMRNIVKNFFSVTIAFLLLLSISAAAQKACLISIAVQTNSSDFKKIKMNTLKVLAEMASTVIAGLK